MSIAVTVSSAAGKVVDDVEGGHEIVRRRVDRERVAQLEADVAESQVPRFCLRGLDPLLGDVDPGHAARGKRVCDQVRRMPVAGADVDHVQAGTEALDQAVDERQRDLDQAGIVDLRGLLGPERLTSATASAASSCGTIAPR